MRLVLALAAAFFMSAVMAADASAQDAAGQPAAAPAAADAQKRIAFVLGDETYAAGALPTAANDAGLIAQTLQAAGFEVIGARDLDAETLRQSYANFLKRVSDAGPNTVAFVYLAGYGLQYGTDNYFVPIGADVTKTAADIPIESIRLSDLYGPLEALNLKARFLVFDAAYKLPFDVGGTAVAGLSLVDATPGTLIAYNSAPGTVAPVGKGNYGTYAQSLAAELRDGGIAPDEIFDRVRLRVSDESKGAEVPWDASKIDKGFVFFQRGAGAPPPATSPEQMVDLTSKPLKDLPVTQAYTAALARDSVESYSQFCNAYPHDALAKRARVLLAARREAITWRRTIAVDTPAAYWSYLSRYPRGPHAADARFRLGQLSVAEAPPPDYAPISYDVPPPPPDEFAYVDAPVVYFDDPIYDFPPPPPPPPYWLPPVPVAFIDLAPPPPPIGLFFLPVPPFVPLPVYFGPPPFVAYPVNNYFFSGGAPGVPIGGAGVVVGLHESIPGGGPRNFAAGAAAVGAGAVAAGVLLPAAAQQRAAVLNQRGITTPAQLRDARARPGGIGAAGPGADHALPGQRPGQTLGQRGGERPGLDRAGRPGAPGARPGLERNNAAGRPGPGERNAAGRPGVAERNVAGRPTPGERAGAGPEGRRGAAAGERPRGEAGRQERDAQRRARVDERRAQPGRAEARAAAGQRRAEARQDRRGAEPRAAARPQVRASERENGRPGGGFGARPGGFAEQRPGGFGGPRPGGFGGGAPRPQAFGGPRPGGFGGGAPRPQAFGGPRPGGFGGGAPRPQAFGGPRPGGFGGGGPRPGGFGGGGPRPGGFGGGGPRPGGFGGGGHPAPGGGHPGIR